MPVPCPEMLAICAALKWEVRPVLRTLRQVRRVSKGPLRAWHGTTMSQIGDIVVFQTGIGPRRAAENARKALGLFPITALINTGCAGGLVPDLCTGSLVIASSVLRTEQDDQSGYPTDPDWSRRLLDASRQSGLPAREAIIATTNVPLLRAEQKHDVYQRLAAVAVDMESAAVAAVAGEKAIPFACARFILDDAATNLPSLDGLADEYGRPHLLALAARTLTHPGDIPHLLILNRLSRLVETKIEQFFRVALENSPGAQKSN